MSSITPEKFIIELNLLYKMDNDVRRQDGNLRSVGLVSASVFFDKSFTALNFV